MSKTLYFAYGSNLHLEQMKDRCPDSEVFMSFILKDFKLVFRTVADIEKHTRSEVNGVIFKISQKDENSLDRYEGVPTLYKKEYFEINIEEKRNKVLYYKMISLYDGYGSPSLQYYQVIEKGYEQNSLNNQSLIDAREFSIKNSKSSTYTSKRWKD
jgi:hypothetical protein